MRPTTPTNLRSSRVSPDAITRGRRYLDEPKYSDEDLVYAISGMRRQIDKISKELAFRSKSQPSFDPTSRYNSQDSVENVVGSELDKSIYRESSEPIMNNCEYDGGYRSTHADRIEPLQTPHIHITDDVHYKNHHNVFKNTDTHVGGKLIHVNSYII